VEAPGARPSPPLAEVTFLGVPDGVTGKPLLKRRRRLKDAVRLFHEDLFHCPLFFFPRVRRVRFNFVLGRDESDLFVHSPVMLPFPVLSPVSSPDFSVLSLGAVGEKEAVGS